MKNSFFKSSILEKIKNTHFEEDLSTEHKMAVEYINQVDKRSVYPGQQAINNLQAFDEEMSSEPWEH